MQKNIQIYTCLLKLPRKQESVTDGGTAAITISPHRYRGGIKIERSFTYDLQLQYILTIEIVSSFDITRNVAKKSNGN